MYSTINMCVCVVLVRVTSEETQCFDIVIAVCNGNVKKIVQSPFTAAARRNNVSSRM